MADPVKDRVLVWLLPPESGGHAPPAEPPPELQTLLRAYESLAQVIAVLVEGGPERTVALRKLMESRDSAVRALVVPGG